MNASPQPRSEQASAHTPYGDVDLDTLRYNDLAPLLKDGIIGKGGFNPSRLFGNLTSLSAATSSPRVISFLWLCASETMRNSGVQRNLYDSMFQEFWDVHKKDIKDFLSDAPLDFLSINSQYIGESFFETNTIHRILSERLNVLKETATPHNLESLLRVYRGLRLMPSSDIMANTPSIDIQSHHDLVKYIHLLHSISRAGLSIANTSIMDTMKQIYPRIDRLYPSSRNQLLWSVTAQFAFAHDGGIEMPLSLQTSYRYLLDNLKPYINQDPGLRRTFNLASIILENDIANAQYNDEDSISKSEYKFMHDAREYLLTKDERADLKRADIAKHVTRLDREVDGHYMIGDKPVIIEFDGKFHYRESLTDNSDEPNGSTKLQTHILRKLFPEHVIIRLHYKLGNEFTSLPAEQKPVTFGKLREIIGGLESDAYYIDLHNGRLRTQTARELQERHNNEYGITRQPTQM